MLLINMLSINEILLREKENIKNFSFIAARIFFYFFVLSFFDSHGFRISFCIYFVVLLFNFQLVYIYIISDYVYIEFH